MQTLRVRWSACFGGEGNSKGFGDWDTSPSGSAKQGRNQPLCGMLILVGPLLCTRHGGEQYSLAYPSLSMIPH